MDFLILKLLGGMKMTFKAFMQKLGRSVLFPIAALPIAGLIIRFGADDMLNIPLLGAAGTIFANMDMLFALSIVIGFAKSKDKAIPAITGFLSLIILKEGLKIMNPDLNMGVFGGIVAGLIAAYIYNKFKNTELPSVLSFFGGEKTPISVIIPTMIAASGILGIVWPFMQNGIDKFAHGMVKLGAVGVFLFGFLNRLLIPFGLHHVLNSYIYFALGEYKDSKGNIITGEIPRFIAGDATSGSFLVGFFVIMMFGIPAIALAITNAAKKSRRDNVKGLMSSGSITSLITGITEPVEFSFLFASPLLYFIHCIYTGLAFAILYIFDVRLGFSFGTGIVDFILNFNKGINTWIIIPVGIFFFILYYFTFYFLIIKFNIKVIGREDEVEYGDESIEEEENLMLSHKNYEYMAKKIIENIGGKENIVSFQNCITRLRIELIDTNLVNEIKLKQTGAHAVIKTDEKNIQIVIGPEVTNVIIYMNRQIDKKG